VKEAKLAYAKRIDPQHMPKSKLAPHVLGLRYERRLVKALKSRGFDLDHNPWYEYRNGREAKASTCCPDIVLYDLAKNLALVIEVKLTLVPEALQKLHDLYLPVVQLATGFKVSPLVVFRNTSLKLPAHSSFYQASQASPPYFQWLGNPKVLL